METGAEKAMRAAVFVGPRMWVACCPRKLTAAVDGSGHVDEGTELVAQRRGL